jgi:hypothetical protein
VRPTNAEVARRLRLVGSMLADGYSRAEIISHFESQGISGRTASAYLARVASLWHADAARDLPRLRAETRARLIHRLRQCVRAESWTAAATVERLLIDVDGVAAPQKLEATVTPGAMQTQANVLADALGGALVQAIDELVPEEDLRVAILRRVRELQQEYVRRQQDAAQLEHDSVAAEADVIAELAEIESGAAGDDEPGVDGDAPE